MYLSQKQLQQGGQKFFPLIYLQISYFKEFYYFFGYSQIYIINSLNIQLYLVIYGESNFHLGNKYYYRLYKFLYQEPLVINKNQFLQNRISYDFESQNIILMFQRIINQDLKFLNGKTKFLSYQNQLISIIVQLYAKNGIIGLQISSQLVT
ncbi:hypothetical protein pb186bvf_021152 [Paramecium bursaria]